MGSTRKRRRLSITATVAAVLGLLLALGLVLHERPDSEPTRLESRPGSVAPGSSPGHLGAAPVPPPSGGLRIRGVVLDDRGPVAGVRVSASRPEVGQTLSELPCPPDEGEDPSEAGLQSLPECLGKATPLLLELTAAREGEAPVFAEVLTAGDGTFALEGLPAGTFTLWALGEHGAVSRSGVPSGVESVELRLGEGLTLEGLVVGEQVPVPDARVTVIHAGHTRFFDARTGADGRFRIGPLPASRYLLAISAEGWLPGLFTPEELNGREPRLELFRPRRLTGRVLSGGAPAPGVEVRLESRSQSPGGASPVVKTDAHGRFVFEPLAPDHYRLTAEQAGRAALVQLELANDTPWPEAVLHLGTAFFVEGTVRDDTGRPVPGAHMTAVLAGLNGWPSRTRTGPDGHYRIGPMEHGLHEFYLWAERHLNASLERELEEGSGPVDFTLERATSVLGTVVDTGGQPLADIKLFLETPGPRNPRHGNTVAVARSDADGRFVLDADRPGAYRIDIQDESVLPEQLPVQAPAEGVRVVLRRGGSVSGTLMDPQGIPLTQGTLVLWDQQGETKGAVRMGPVDETGRFLLRGVKPGHYMLEALLPEAGVVRSAARAVEVMDGEQVEVSLRFEAGRDLSGVVVDGAGHPIAGAFIHASPSSEPGWRRGGARTPLVMVDADGPMDVRSGPDGRFTLHGLADDAYDVSARKDGYRLPGDAASRVSAGSPEVRIVLERLGRIHGRLVGPAGAPVTGFEVNGEPQEDPGGAFAVPFTRSGIQKLTISVPEMARVVRSVPVREGVDVDLGEIRMGPGRKLRGRILDAETSEPVRAFIRYTDAALDSASPISRVWGNLLAQADGSFDLPYVEARPLTLVVEDEEHLPRRLSVDERTEEVTVRLERGARVEMHVRDDQGRPMGALLNFDRDEGGGTSLQLEGTGVVRGLAPGNYTVRLALLQGDSRPIFFRPRRVQVPASGRVSLTFEGEPGGATVRLAVKAEHVRSVWLRPGGAPPIATGLDLERALGGALCADREGEADTQWVLHHVPPGPTTLLIINDEDDSLHREELDIPPGGTLAREVRPSWRMIHDEED